MNLENRKILSECGQKVIQDENLPMPSKIIFRIGGYNKRNGTLYRTKTQLNDSGFDYKIILYMAKAEFIPDPNGQFIDKDGNKLRKGVCGKLRSFSEIVETLAHEIAHLKYLRHGAEHKHYTDIIYNKINNELKLRGIQTE